MEDFNIMVFLLYIATSVLCRTSSKAKWTFIVSKQKTGHILSYIQATVAAKGSFEVSMLYAPTQITTCGNNS